MSQVASFVFDKCAKRMRPQLRPLRGLSYWTELVLGFSKIGVPCGGDRRGLCLRRLNPETLF